MESNTGAGWRAGPSRQQSVSLTPIEYRALRLLASNERNDNMSAVIGRMIDAAMTAEYGRDWRNRAPLDTAVSS